jgi:hypothetical protein
MDYKQWWTKSDRKESDLGQWLARLLMLLAKRKGRKSDNNFLLFTQYMILCLCSLYMLSSRHELLCGALCAHAARMSMPHGNLG